MELLRKLIYYYWFILILTVGIGQEFTGCMDDGFQQWSPNLGSPACNYNQFATIEGECKYNDCLGDCPVILENSIWIENPDYNNKQYDDCGECGGDGSTCSDCNGVPNGLAYINPLCVDSDINEDGCVGGDTGNSDCLNIDLSFGGYMESNSTDTIKVFVNKLDTLKSLDIEFQYDSSVLTITEFSLNGTALFNSGYNVDDTTFIESDNLSQVDFTLYFDPRTNTNFELFSHDGPEHIFNIVLEAMEIEADITTQIIINELSVNEILMDDSNWKGGEILVMIPSGCMDPTACNYNSNVVEDDGSCIMEPDCFGVCGGTAVYDACGVCDGIETNSNNCFCADENIIYDCNGDCAPMQGCPDQFSFTAGCAFKDTNCYDVCVGGATEQYPCEQDCAGEWGGIAYEDNCEVCISNIVGNIIPGVLDSIDCFSSGFKIYNSNGIEEDDFIIKELDTIYVVLQMQNLPNSLEGLTFHINYNSNDLFLNNWSLSPEEFNLEEELTGELNNSIDLYMDIDSTSIDSAIFKAVMYTTNELYQGNGGNMFFLQFFNIGTDGDSTVISYNKVQVNEHAMKEQNYTSQVIYLGDCNGVFNGECLSNDEYQLIPKGYHLSQNYPNPFNPITYIQYSVPNFDFITINIINISGQIIKTIVQNSHQPGKYEIMWDGTNHNGISVPSGIYFYKMDADEFASVRKLVLIK